MSTQTICDVCQQPKRTPFKVTEKDGTVYDICSAACFSEHAKASEIKAKCRTCDGEGRTDGNEDISERAPWSFWANLAPGQDIAVRMRWVKPVPCTECHGTGQEQP